MEEIESNLFPIQVSSGVVFKAELQLGGESHLHN